MGGPDTTGSAAGGVPGRADVAFGAALAAFGVAAVWVLPALPQEFIHRHLWALRQLAGLPSAARAAISLALAAAAVPRGASAVAAVASRLAAAWRRLPRCVRRAAAAPALFAVFWALRT
ncbi:MAG: hypothetical protein D6718_13085, partial [Acidobacteria bacterium]